MYVDKQSIPSLDPEFSIHELSYNDLILLRSILRAYLETMEDSLKKENTEETKKELVFRSKKCETMLTAISNGFKIK